MTVKDSQDDNKGLRMTVKDSQDDNKGLRMTVKDSQDDSKGLRMAALRSWLLVSCALNLFGANPLFLSPLAGES
jgi:hypothetical protein